MASNHYPAGNTNGGHPPPPSQGNLAPMAAPGAGPIPAAGPAAVAAALMQHQQQHQQASFLQLQQLQQQPPAPPPLPLQPPPQQQIPPQNAPSHPQPQPQQFVPGPFYTLQQQQAFAQARLAAAAMQAQQQQQQQQQAALQAQQQQQQQQQQQLQQHHHHQQQQQQQPQHQQQQHQQQQHQQQQHQQQQSAYAFMQQTLQPAPNSNSTVTGGSHPTSPPSVLPAAPAYNGANAAMAPTAAPPAAAAPAPKVGRKRKPPSPELVPVRKMPPSAKTPKVAPTVTAARKPPPAPTPPSTSAHVEPQTVCMSSTAAQLIRNAMAESNSCDIPAASPSPADASADPTATAPALGRPLTAEEKKRSSRDRNREHARCTRLRKKAYVNKLKDLVDGLHAERNEDARKRRVAVQQLAEVQGLRRKVVYTFLEYHSRYERDATRWSTILEKEFWLKQPVTPYRSFRRCEIQKGSRILKGVDAMIRDAASMSVMIETIGSRNLRWMHRKRDDFLTRDAFKHASAAGSQALRIRSRTGGGNMPSSIDRRNSRLHQAISSLSSSESSTGPGSGAEEERRLAQRKKGQGKGSGEHRGHHGVEEKQSQQNSASDGTAKKVSSSSSGSDGPPSNDFHDYHAPSLPDPLPGSGGSSPSSESPQDMDSDICVAGQHMCTDSSSGEEDKERKNVAALNQGNVDSSTALRAEQIDNTASHPPPMRTNLPPNIARSGGIQHNVKAVVQLAQPASSTVAASAAATASLPNGHANLSRAPATTLPPFAGIGKRKHPPPNPQAAGVSAQNGNDKHHPIAATSSSVLPPRGPTLPPIAHHHTTGHHNSNGNANHRNNEEEEENRSKNSFGLHPSSRGNIITINNDMTSTSSQSSSQSCNRGISAHYHINEDDMIITNDILMCPFIFRSQEAVWCGALAECVQPGMLRATFSRTNKLRNVEMVFDAMGFCQQLERASGNEGMAQIIPNSLEMALGTPNSDEHARVITLAKEPDFKIVSVNEAFTRVTGYTQLDVEGKDLRGVLSEGERRAEEDPGAAAGARATTLHSFEAVAKKGMCASSTNLHFDINGREFLNFMCSYPLSNLRDEVTHIVHVCQELPARE